VFDGLLQFPKGWNKLVENLQVGDAILIHYDSKSKAGDWRWGCMTHADPDQDGLVKMVLVGYTIPGRAGCVMKELEVAVQRLVLLYAQAEMDADWQGETGDTD